jgi:hypothetical protein
MNRDELIESTRALVMAGHPLSGAAAKSLLAEIDRLKAECVEYSELSKSVEWLARYNAKVEWGQALIESSKVVTVTARNHTIQRAWLIENEDHSRGSVPCRELLVAVDALDKSIGS